jgi:hypothetical protein
MENVMWTIFVGQTLWVRSHAGNTHVFRGQKMVWIGPLARAMTMEERDATPTAKGFGCVRLNGKVENYPLVEIPGDQLSPPMAEEKLKSCWIISDPSGHQTETVALDSVTDPALNMTVPRDELCYPDGSVVPHANYRTTLFTRHERKWVALVS